MEIKIGDKLENIQLPNIQGHSFNTSSIQNKKILITFYRFASCPLCNLRINEIVKRYQEFGKDFTIVAIFNSPIENLKRYTKKHKAPFEILADEKFEYFKKYNVKRSLIKFFISQLKRFVAINKAMLKGFIPWTFNGYIDILPVDVLINQSGVVENVKYGTDIGDHMPLNDIIKFSNS